MNWLFQTSKTIFDTSLTLLVLAAMMGNPCCFMLALENSKRERARDVDIPTLEGAVHFYQRIAGHRPDSLKRLVDCGLLERVPTDPWDEPYIYRVEGDTACVGTYATDRAPGGTDNDADIGFWCGPNAACRAPDP